MKKIIIISALFFMTIAAYAQQGLYARINIGYEFPLAGDSYAKSSNNTSSTYGKTSYGMGVLPMLGIGYMFNDNVGVDLGLGYMMGGTVKTTSDDGTTTQTDKTKVSCFLIQPALRLAANTDKNIYPYAKVGLAFGIAPSGSDKYSSVTGGVTTSESATIKFNSGIGMSGAAGVAFKINDMLHFTAEVNMMAMSVYLKSISSNGTTTNFTTSTTTTGNNQATYAFTYSHVGLSIGLMANLNGSKK